MIQVWVFKRRVGEFMCRSEAEQEGEAEESNNGSRGTFLAWQASCLLYLSVCLHGCCPVTDVSLTGY